MVDWNKLMKDLSEKYPGKFIPYDPVTGPLLADAFVCAVSYETERLGRPPSFTDIVEHMKQFGMDRSIVSRAHSYSLDVVADRWEKSPNGTHYRGMFLPLHPKDYHKKRGWPPEPWEGTERWTGPK